MKVQLAPIVPPVLLIREKQVSIIKSPSSNPAATNQAIYYLQAGSILPGNWFIALVNTPHQGVPGVTQLHSYTVSSSYTAEDFFPS